MPVKLAVGLSRKQGLPDYGSVGASCHLEIELASDILSGAGASLQRQAEIALDACRQVVDSELGRHSQASAEDSEVVPELHDRSSDVLMRDRLEPPMQRSATPKQLRAIERLALRLGMNPADFFSERIGMTPPHALSIAEASNLIDELQQMGHLDRQMAG